MAYYRLGFQTLADQVRRSVRSVRGNQWMFRMGHPDDHPLRIDPRLIERREGSPPPILVERTAVRMDLSHSGWSDIFFLGMDFPEGARVLNVSVDLAVHGRDPEPLPPIEVALRVIDEPVLRLVSVDLKAMAEITTIAEVFDFAKDYLGLLKAGMIAVGHRAGRAGRLGTAAGRSAAPRRRPGPRPGDRQHVNEIPKGSRLAVSTNLLAAIIAVCMRATGQVHSLDRPAGRARAADGRRPRDPRRMAGRLGRRLAGLGRRLAGHQDDRRLRRRRPTIPNGASAAGGSCRGTRSSAPAMSRRKRANCSRQLRARAWRHGAERRPDPGNGHREVPAPRAARVGRPARGDADHLPHRGASSAAATCAAWPPTRWPTSAGRSRRSSPGRATTTPRP